MNLTARSVLAIPMHPEAEGDSGSVCAPQLDTTRELATVAHRAGIGHGGPAGGWPLRVPFTGMLTGFGSSYPARTGLGDVAR